MSTEKDGDGETSSEAKVPPAEKASAQPEPTGDEPPARPSVMDMLAKPVSYPDDGPVAGGLRKVDHYAGLLQQIALFVIFAFVIVSGAAQAISTKLLGKSLLWSFDIVRGGTFAIALIGASFASHQARHLSMDIASRFMSARNRQILRVVLGMFTIFAAFLLLESGLRLYERVGAEGGHSGVIPMTTVALMIPLGAGLIMFHSMLHILIEIDYLRRGKQPPEKVPTGH